MTEYIRAKHPNPERPNMSDDFSDEQLPGCGETVVLEYHGSAPPVQEGDRFRERCPYCNGHNARLKVVEVPSDD